MKRTLAVLLFFSVLRPGWAFSATVSIADLIASSDRYDGKQVRTVGFVHMDQPPLQDEGSDSVCPGPAIKRSACLNLILPRILPDRKTFKDGERTITGIFRKNRGPRAKWGGLLSEVTLESPPPSPPGPRELKFKPETTHGQILLPGQRPPSSTMEESQKAFLPDTTPAVQPER